MTTVTKQAQDARLNEIVRQKAMKRLLEIQEEKKRYDWRANARPNQLEPENNDKPIILIMAGRGFGKALPLSTPIPVPSGWKTLGELEVGDTVFDEQGKPCKVEAVFDNDPKETYQIEFSDHSTIRACADHQWVTFTHNERKAYGRSNFGGTGKKEYISGWPAWENKNGIGPQIRTTKQIFDTVDKSHCIPVCEPLELPTADLPLDPYVLGVWLGDGGTRAGGVCLNNADAEDILKNMRLGGVEVAGVPVWNSEGSCNYRLHMIGGSYGARNKQGQFIGDGSFHSELKRLGFFGNKHVPAAYLRASKEQRLALLQGLMDTDGESCKRVSYVAFSNTNENIAMAVYELAASLGQKPRIKSGIPKLYGKPCARRWCVSWRPTIQVFRCRRKAERLSFYGNQFLRSQARHIKNVTPTEPEPMRCITVDSPNAMFLAGREMIPTHNTRTGCEWIREKIEGGAKHLGMTSPTASDCRDVLVEGPSGLLYCCPPEMGAHYEPSKRKVSFNKKSSNAYGATVHLYSADEPARFRGPQHEFMLCDEIAYYPDPTTIFDTIMLGLRLGKNPKLMATTTPLPIRLLKDLVARKGKDVYVVNGSTYENLDNLAPVFKAQVLAKYEGTRLGRQEIEGELITAIEGALWQPEWFQYVDRNRLPDFKRIGVGIDPSTSSTTRSDEAGVIVAGITQDDVPYVLEDRSIRGTPEKWAMAAITAYNKWDADFLVAERNQGGDMVKTTIHAVEPLVPVKLVHANRGKLLRAEPVSLLYEKRQAYHVKGLEQLEAEMCTYDGTGNSPNRLDAAVYVLTELLFSRGNFRWDVF